jgi:hypothetical protein
MGISIPLFSVTVLFSKLNIWPLVTGAGFPAQLAKRASSIDIDEINTSRFVVNRFCLIFISNLHKK